MSGKTDSGTDQIKALIEWSAEDKKMILLLVTFDLAVLGLMASDKVFGTAASLNDVVLFACLLLMASAVLLMLYLHKTHMTTLSLIELLSNPDYRKGREIVDRTWASNKVTYWWGVSLGAIAVVILLFNACIVSRRDGPPNGSTQVAPTKPSSVPLTRGTPPAGQEPRHGSRSAHG